MRRFLHGLLVGVLTLWIPIDSAVAGWWHHHHRHSMPVVWGPAFPAPCGTGTPFPGWAGAIVIDDRPLGAPPPFAVFAAPRAEVVVDGWITTTTIEESIVDEGTIVEEGPILGGDCACDPCQGDTSADTGTVFEGTVIEGASVSGVPTPADAGIGSEGPVTNSRPIEHSRAVGNEAIGTQRVETTPEAESPTPLEIPGTAATTSADPAAAAPSGNAGEPAPSVLEPWEPKTVQGDTAAEPATDEPVAETMEEAEAFERADEPADEPIAADDDTSPSEPRRRNLFDEAPADEAEAFEAPRATEDDLPPGDAFEAPADDDFGIPDEAPMDEGDEGDEMPADDFGDDADAPASDDSGFEPATEAPMEDAPADEPVEDGFEGDPGMEGEPEPLEEETPAEADPFDTNVLHTPGQPMRAWRDDTGRHGTEGRLVEVHADRVRILKVSGRYTTVPLTRLSRADADHVAGVRLAVGRSAAGPDETAGL